MDGEPPRKHPRGLASETSGLVFVPLREFSQGHATESVQDDDDRDPEEPTGDNGTEPYVANEVIDLVFIEPGNQDEDPAVSSPEFTHQLFENEELAFIESEPAGDDEADDFLRTSVLVRLDDLRHAVMLPAGLSEKELGLFKDGLQLALPPDTKVLPHDPDIDTAIDEFSAEPCVCSAVPGKMVHSFKTRGKESYELWLATNKDGGAVELLSRFEKLAIWHIETADSVNFSGDDRWQVMFLVRRRKARSLFVGYYTLFTFRNPFAGNRLRICQALVIPPYQGKGLGREMMLAVYRMCASLPEVIEVTVEDPAPGFQRMRDSVDLEWACEKELHGEGSRCGMSHESFFDTLLSPPSPSGAHAAGALAALAKELKLTLAQTTFVYEAWRYFLFREKSRAKLQRADDDADKTQTDSKASKNQGDDIDDEGDEDEEDEEMKAFRLEVKRRLLKANSELAKLDKPNMQSRLEDLYSQECARYDQVASRIQGIRSRRKQRAADAAFSESLKLLQ